MQGCEYEVVTNGTRTTRVRWKRVCLTPKLRRELQHCLLLAIDDLSTDRASIRPSIAVVLNDALLLLGKEMVILAASSQSPKYYYCYYYYYYCCCYDYFLHTVIIAMV